MKHKRNTQNKESLKIGLRFDSDPELFRKLKAIAAQEYRKPTQVAMIAVREFVERREQPAA